MSRDPFDDLAMALRRHTARAVGEPVRHLRCRVTDLTPLMMKTEDGAIELSEDDEDVEISRHIVHLRDTGDVEVGDLMDVREDADGYLVNVIIV